MSSNQAADPIAEIKASFPDASVTADTVWIFFDEFGICAGPSEQNAPMWWVDQRRWNAGHDELEERPFRTYEVRPDRVARTVAHLAARHLPDEREPEDVVAALRDAFPVVRSISGDAYLLEAEGFVVIAKPYAPIAGSWAIGLHRSVDDPETDLPRLEMAVLDRTELVEGVREMVFAAEDFKHPTRDLDAAFLRGQNEILEDIAKGIVPNTVSTFAELHDHVDANAYGGLFELEIDPADDEQVGFANNLQNRLGEWLRNRPNSKAVVQIPGWTRAYYDNGRITKIVYTPYAASAGHFGASTLLDDGDENLDIADIDGPFWKAVQGYISSLANDDDDPVIAWQE